MVGSMLHKRRGALKQGALVVREAILRVEDHLVDADPGLLRLTLALRGTLSVVLATAAAMTASRLLGWPVLDFAAAITLSMMTPFLSREPTLRQRQRTLLVLSLPAVAATAATALLHGQGPIGDSCFLLLVFLGFLLQPRGPRFMGVGLVSVVVTYVGLYLELPPETLPRQMLAIAAALPVIAFACFVAVPVNPVATQRRMVAAVQARAARVLQAARGDAAPAHLQRDLVRLNEAALAADDQLSLIHPGGREALRAGLVDVELAAARMVVALRSDPPGGTTPTPRQAVRLRLHEARMRRGGRYAMAHGLPNTSTLRDALLDLGHATHALTLAAAEAGAGSARPAAPPPGPLAWKAAVRVTLAAGLAMAGGIALSPQRWFWAVMTVYVVLLNARTRGDAITRGLQRLGGTLLGIASGLVLAVGLAGSAGLQAVALVGSVFGMYYLFLVSYTAGIFCVTVMLGLLYGMLGASLDTVLTLRLEETAVGAAAAILVAVFVFPTSTRSQVALSGRAVLVALAATVRASRHALLGVPDVPPTEAMRAVDRQVADLRLALAPLVAGRALLRRIPTDRSVSALLDCVHWARVLAAAAQGRGAVEDAAGLFERATRIEAKLAGLAEEKQVPEPDALSPRRVATADAISAQAALDGLDQSIDLLAERLQVSALGSFALLA